MNVQQTIDGLFFIGIFGTTLNSETRKLLSNINPSGIILFARNIESPAQLVQLNRDLQQFASDNYGRGIFIAVDQEGGRVARLKHPFVDVLPMYRLAQANDSSSVLKNVMMQMALELRLSGFNLDFAPVMDVLSLTENISTTVIGDRSFGVDPNRVSELGEIVVECLKFHGVIPCAKHFPGHGGTLVDSHKALPVDTRARGEILNRDLVPFKEAIKRNIDMLMTAHVLYPQIDPQHVATTSKIIINDLLRCELDYKGVVITDDLDMAAVAEQHSVGDIAIRSLDAGADLILICNAPEKAFVARDAIKEALASGRLSQDRIQDSITRIDNLRIKYLHSFVPAKPEKLAAYFAARSTVI
jgi:beta-N-acetylhexosaminidase